LNEGRIRYISLPVLLKLHTGEKFAITAGPQIDFAVNVNDERNIITEEDINKTSFSLSGGLELFPRGKVTIFGRYIHGFSNMDARENHTSTTEYKNQNIQLGLKLRLFGGQKTVYEATSVPVVVADSDGDGIADDVDKCPNQFGIAKYQGCPVPDTDGDGINDELDKCPTVAGIAKYEGCPIPDTDGDGINDEQDKCPTVAGIAKYDGCPPPDRDNDGINDDEDRCPDIAGIAANNGCPEVPANVSKSLGVAAEGIHFGTGTNNMKLTTKSYASLDQIVALMNEHPGLRIRVEGHTDNVGEEDANEDLSSAQAKAVMDYLISKGVPEDRISKEGFGESQPIADNNTAAGRAKK
jgi:outer membrane protein OmpA-like peptidoglycan-associated protein